MNKTEDIILKAKVSGIFVLSTAIIFIITLLLGYSIYLESGINNFSILILIFSLCCVELMMIIKKLFIMFSTELYFNKKRIYGKMGIFSTDEMDSPLSKINNVRIKQNLLGKIFDYATIIIRTSSDSYVFDGIAKPYIFKKGLNDLLDNLYK